MRIAILSDIHAGLGADDIALRNLHATAVLRATEYMHDQNIDELVLNGDTTDHLANVHAAGTRADIAQEVLAPLVMLMNDRRSKMKVILIAGNTDWPIADSDVATREIFFEYTGFPKEQVSIPHGGLLHVVENDDVSVVCTHGHAFKPAQWGHTGRMYEEDYAGLWESLGMPSQQFLDAIRGATHGSHHHDYLKAVAVGSVVKQLPRMVREMAIDLLSRKYTAAFEQHYAKTLSLFSQKIHKKVFGVIGHTHVAGVRKYEGINVLNTGTTSADPIPLQRLSDPRAHLAMIDTEKGTYTLLQTFDASQPDVASKIIATGSFSTP